VIENVPAAKSTYFPWLDVPPQALSAVWIVELVEPAGMVEPDWVYDPEGMPPGMPAFTQYGQAHRPGDVWLIGLQGVFSAVVE
jgi:hypothetical protein